MQQSECVGSVIRLTQRETYQAGVFLYFSCLVAQNWTTRSPDESIPAGTGSFADAGRMYSCLGMSVFGCCLEDFSPSLCPSVSHIAGPSPAPSRLPLWSEAKSLWTPLISGSCAAASQRRMGYGNPGTVLGNTSPKGKNTSSSGQQKWKLQKCHNLC